jgi:sodium/potassium/calcium exchanger 6
VAALGLAAVMVAATLRAGTVGPAHISVFVAVYLVFVAIVLVADVYHRTVVLPRLERLRHEREVQRQQALSQQLQQRAGDDLNQLAELETTAETTPNILSTILTSISNYDNTTTTNNNNNDTTQDGWGVESDDVIHERPVVLHGANGILTPTKQRTQDQLDDNDLNPSVGNYTILTDGMDHICTQHGFSAHNWKGAWNDGMYELEMELHDVWKDCKDDDQPLYEKILLVCEFPFTVLRKLTVPIPCEGYYVRAVVATSTVLSSIWCAFYLWNQHDMNIVFHKPPMFVIQFVLCFVVGALILRYAPGGGDGVLNLKIATPLALYGFMVAATWIDWIANHLVQLLDLLGIVCGIPGSVMGLTILAWGNSMSDLTANLTMARKGLANMAMTACYAGPVFNILIGLSFGFSSLAAQTGNPTTHVSMNPSIVTGFAFLVINAVGLLVVGVVLNPGRIPKAYGYGMLLLYMIYVVLSVVLQFSKNGSS